MTDRTKYYFRFRLAERLEHWLLVASFSTLAVTGLVQKFATVAISQGVIRLLGGIESVRIIHRFAAVVLMLEAIYHIGVVGYKIFVRRDRTSMLPGVSDIKIAWRSLLFNLGFRDQKPQKGRYTFEEKAEYWAVVWGTVLMAITGFMMWNPIATTRILPGEFVPAAKAAHGGEALLAVLAIIVWHMYHVHIRHFNRSMITGTLTEEEMLDEHALELADLKAGVPPPMDLAAVKKRQAVYLPVFGVIAVVMLVGVYFFINFEETAITTLPLAEQVEVFVPLPPTPQPTPLPTKPPPIDGATTWQDGFGVLFQDKCGACHQGPTSLGGLDLSSYKTSLDGGETGPAILPGDPGNSLLIIRQATGDHPGQLSPDELASVRQWIEAAAPEK